MGSQGKVQNEREIGHTLLLGSRVLCGFWDKARLVNLNKKSQILVYPMGVLTLGHRKERCWEVGDAVDHRGC